MTTDLKQRDTQTQMSGRRRLAVLAAIVALVLVGGMFTARAFIDRTLPEEYSNAKPVSAAQLEQDYGIKLDLVGVVAAGGMVDLQFEVTDAAKADRLLTDGTLQASVFSENDKLLLFTSHSRHHAIEPADGGSYFVLFGNRQGTVQRGTSVSVIFGSIRVDHVVAES